MQLNVKQRKLTFHIKIFMKERFKGFHTGLLETRRSLNHCVVVQIKYLFIGNYLLVSKTLSLPCTEFTYPQSNK